jgi:hypothetical protein
MLGMYIHIALAYNHPSPLHNWTPQDWRSYLQAGAPWATTRRSGQCHRMPP